MVRKIIALVVVAATVMFAGCSFKEHNAMIAQANAAKFTAYTQAMNSAETEGARIAIAMAFAAGMGDQPFVKPETGLDYMKAGVPYVQMATNLWGQEFGDRYDSPSIEAGRDVFINSSKADVNSGTIMETSKSPWSSANYSFMMEEIVAPEE